MTRARRRDRLHDVRGRPDRVRRRRPRILAQAATSGPEVKQCFDAAPARISYRDPTIAADGSADIAVACRGDGTSIFRVRHAAAGVVVERLVNTGTEISALRAGDVTGDRVDDLLLLEGDAVTSLVVYPQCSSREETTCTPPPRRSP